MATLLTIIDTLAAAFVFGATVWFFFIQAPVLLSKIGRERFVPIQMNATKVLFKALVVTTAVMVAANLAGGNGPLSMAGGSALLALLGALINERFLVPKALKAGGRGYKAIKGKDVEADTAGFALDGVSADTATMHRLVVVFVVVMLAGVVPHLLMLTGVIAG